MHADSVVYRAGKGASAGLVDADPITTEVIRNGLNSAANQMKRALIRTSFSPVIYEVLDFAVAIYDREIRMLAQAPSLPFFMGTMNFCVEAAVEAAGGESALEPGDIVLYNFPYGTGSHPQDAAVGVRTQEEDLAQEDLFDVAGGGFEDRGLVCRGGKVAAHGVEGRGAGLALAGGFGLAAQARGESRDGEAGDQHHREGDQVFGVGHREVQVRRDEEEIEGGH